MSTRSGACTRPKGFEYDYAGVIWGRDLVYRPRRGWIGQPEFSHDSVVKRAAAKDPARFTALVKHTYRVLLPAACAAATCPSRTQQTRDFVLGRVEWPEELE